MVEFPDYYSLNQTKSIATGISELIGGVFGVGWKNKRALQETRFYGFSAGVYVAKKLSKLLRIMYGDIPRSIFGMLMHDASRKK